MDRPNGDIAVSNEFTVTALGIGVVIIMRLFYDMKKCPNLSVNEKILLVMMILSSPGLGLSFFYLYILNFKKSEI